MLAPWPPQAIPLLVDHRDDYEMDVDDGHSRGDDDDEDDDGDDEDDGDDGDDIYTRGCPMDSVHILRTTG